MTRLFVCGSLAVGALSCGGKAVIDGEPTSTTSTTSGTSSGGGSMGGGNIESIELERALAFVDCFPGSGSGELGLEFSMTFVNSGAGDALVEIVEGRIQGAVGLTTFPVAPASIDVPAASTETYDFIKSGPGLGTRGCDWCSPTDTTLVVELTVDGVPRAFTDNIDSVSCSF